MHDCRGNLCLYCKEKTEDKCIKGGRPRPILEEEELPLITKIDKQEKKWLKEGEEWDCGNT